MWIVRVALSRPYTFIVLAILILLASPIVILRTPVDIFPNINIPVIASIWTYTGLNSDQMEGRITNQVERGIATTVNNIEHIESTTLAGRAIIKVFLQPNASVAAASSQIVAVSLLAIRAMPPGIAPPYVMTYSAATVPIIQLSLFSKTIPEGQLGDWASNFIRPELMTIPGVELPQSYGGKQRQVDVGLNTALLQAKGVSPNDVVNAIGSQNIILPSGTAKMAH